MREVTGKILHPDRGWCGAAAIQHNKSRGLPGSVHLPKLPVRDKIPRPWVEKHFGFEE